MHALVKARHPDLASRPGDLLGNFFAAADREGGELTRTLDEFLDALAIGIVNVVHAYGPDTVVLGGGLMQSSGVILPPLIQRVQRRAWTVPRGSIRLAAASLGNRAAALGVAFHPGLR
jgi:glucokinase